MTVTEEARRIGSIETSALGVVAHGEFAGVGRDLRADAVQLLELLVQGPEDEAPLRHELEDRAKAGVELVEEFALAGVVPVDFAGA